jgi:uncharacterized protein
MGVKPLKNGNLSKVSPYNLNWERIKGVIEFLLSQQGFGKSIQALWSLGLAAMIVLMVGGVILVIPFTIVIYTISLYLFIIIRPKCRDKHFLN